LRKNSLKKLRARGTLILEVDGVGVIDEDLAKLLLLIEKAGSILSASKVLRTAYSRSWEMIARAERVLKVDLIKPRRGGRRGGGARLTKNGKKILNRYLEEYQRMFGRRLNIEEAKVVAPELVYAGSNDLLLEHIFGLLRDRGVEHIEAAWRGSSGGLSLLMLGEADLAGIHLYDSSSSEYNVPFLQKYWLEERVALIRGYEREIGFASKTTFDDPIGALIRGEIRLINRNLGSGTRIYLDYLVKERAKQLGIGFRKASKNIKGYGNEVNTHLEVARAIAMGKADIGLTLRSTAERYGLEFKPLKWEKFDFAVAFDKLGKKPMKKFLEVLRSEELKEIASRLAGYRVSDEAGEIVHKPSM